MPRRPIVAQVEAGGAARPPAGETELRDALARWASGVAVLAFRSDDTIHALTVTAFAGVSLRPPLVMVAVGEQSALAPLLAEGESFALSILAADQRRWAGIFADIYAVDRSGFPAGGDAILAGCIAAFVCRVEAT
jgi:flavin reductase (NADH)